MNGEQPQKKRRWIPIVIGIILAGFVVTIGGCFLAISFFRQSMSITAMSASSADDEFAKLRARFAGQKPLIEFVDGRPQYLGDRDAQKPRSSVPIKSIHVMAWDDDEEQLATFSLPFWLLRLKSGPIRLNDYSQGWDDRGVSFRIEDLEKHGPGLLMDLSERNEGRVIIWME